MAHLGHLDLRSIRLGTTGESGEILLCPGLSFFEGNLSISGNLTANSVTTSGSGIADLCFPIGTPSGSVNNFHPINISQTTFTNNIGLNLTAGTNGCDAFQLIDQYFHTYWLSPAPAPTNGVCTPSPTVLTVTWDPIPVVEAAFLNIDLPHVEQIVIEYVESSLNPSNDWSHANTVTINTGSKLTDTLELHTVGTGSGLVGNTWRQYGFTSGVNHDIRIYGINHHSGQLNYLELFNCSTSAIGVPVAPTGLSDTAQTETSLSFSWTKPNDHDRDTGPLDTSPVISRYQLDYSAISSVRSGGIYTGSHTGTVYTSQTADPTNSATTKTITGLYPGTVYSVDVSARNELNAGYSDPNTDSSSTTDSPSPPALLQLTDANTLNNEAGLIAPYSNSGGYTLDGVSVRDPIINENNGLDIRTSISPIVRHNHLIGSEDTNITVISAYAGLTSDYLSNKASVNLNGLLTINAGPITTSNLKATLVYQNDVDTGANEYSGFWKGIQMYAQGNLPATNFTASLNQYSMAISYESNEVGGSSEIITNPVSFYVDDIAVPPTVSNLGIKNELGGVGIGWEYVSGVPSYSVGAEFTIQFEAIELANKFLRNDREHADIVIQSTGGTAYSNTTTINAVTVDGITHSYYTGTGDDTTSVTKHNGSGAELIEDSGLIQFNDYTVTLSAAADNRYTENFVVKVTPTNLYGVGSAVTAGYVNTGGTALNLRLDTNSIANLSAISGTANKGIQVRSGESQFPTLGTAQDHAGDTYDHTTSLLDSFYDTEMQLINGVYQSPSVGGYSNYSTGYYFSGSPTMPNYSSISPDGNWRYTTFKLSGADAGIAPGTTRERLRVTINNMTGLTINTTTPGLANHRFQIRVVDIGDGTDLDNHTTTIGWMNAAETVSGIGILNGPNDTYCLSQSTSTNSQRDIFIRPGTTTNAEIYIRIGIQNNLSASFSCISVVAQAGAFT